MFSELMHRVDEQFSKELPFVIYRKPNQKEVKIILQKSDQLHQLSDVETSSGFVFASFDNSRNAVLIPTDEVLVAADFAPEKVFLLKAVSVDTSQKEEHVRLVEKAIEEIKKNNFQKVVLSRMVSVKTKIQAPELFKKLLATYESAFCYLWYHPKVGTWLGATPEILLKTENQQFTTMSLAGTQKYVENQNPVWQKKESEEQRLVTDYISSALKGCVSNLTIGDRESTRAGNLWHLRTKLTARIEKGSLARTIDALHPTPAVCGLPMHTTKKFILANENYDRAYYTGFLGELNFKLKKDRNSSSRNQENKAYRAIKKSTTLFVNLRCMQLKDSKATIYVGGGVTRDSEPEKEWEETVAKSKTMLKVLT